VHSLKKMSTSVKTRLCPAVLLSVLLLSAACDRGPQEIRIGQQECDHCRMMISQEQFAAQLITQQGRQYAFDAIECMAALVDSGDGRELDVHSLWVPDFLNPGNWMEAESAWYLQSDGLRSPMALNFSAYSNEDFARSQQSEFGGDVVRWVDVRDIVRDSWSGGAHGHSHANDTDHIHTHSHTN
jgi:copper chaperone NosL